MEKKYKAADKAKRCEKAVKTRTKKSQVKENTTAVVVFGEENQGRPKHKQHNKAAKKMDAGTTGAKRPSNNPDSCTTNQVGEGGSTPEDSQKGGVAQQGKKRGVKKGPISSRRMLDQARRERTKKFEENAAWKI
ncbi:hypothetical protein DCAR_0415090 [Daucus carota subsp. sativus]|uniref:Uncharacterized protein n=1 Tax=Daucus carota subsp. sativus TaxID=79200 RepID=A0A162A6R6_DAUCS|nr:hypothetical protein DCAR_0415090 [Daucus carota subsp. sativus]